MNDVDLSIPRNAWGRCLIETTRLVKNSGGGAAYIRATGHHYPGREHWAAAVFNDDAPEDSCVIDLTARQFDATARSPWRGTLIDWYDDVCDWLNDHIDVAVFTTDPTYAVKADWTDFYARDDHEPGDMTYPWGV